MAVEQQRLAQTCADVVAELIKAHKEGRDVSVVGLKSRMSRKNKYGGVPRLTDLIAAIPVSQLVHAILTTYDVNVCNCCTFCALCYVFLSYPLC